MTELKDLEKTAHEIGQRINTTILSSHAPKEVGFALLLFDLGHGGHLTYVSNANREDMIKVLYECAATLQAGIDQSLLGHGKRQLKG